MRSTYRSAIMLVKVLWVGSLIVGCSGESPATRKPEQQAASRPEPQPQPEVPLPKVESPVEDIDPVRARVEMEAERKETARLKSLGKPAPRLAPAVRARPQAAPPVSEENAARDDHAPAAASHRPLPAPPPMVGSAPPPQAAPAMEPPERPTSIPEGESPVLLERKPGEPPAGSEPSAESQPGTILYSKAEPAEPASEDSSHTVVKVYYATDRATINVADWQQSFRAGWPRITGATAGLGLVLMLWSRRRRGRAIVRGLSWCCLGGAAVLGGLTFAYRIQPATAEGQIGRMYGSDRGDLELGTCEVSIPKDHQVGEMESPSILRLEFRPDPERHIVLQNVSLKPAGEFYADLRSCVERSTGKEAFVFIHGYNVGFETAARRTAQIAYDLKFDGAPIFYSWPSQEGLLAYTVDETNVVWTVPHLKEFLLAVARQSAAESVHLVAHSMGNRALTSALRELALELKSDCPRFHEVVLTAPDIDADVFRRDLAPAITATADRVTLYASSNDEALAASMAVHGYRRAGDSGDHIVVVPGVETVDVSDVDTSFIGHCYYGSNRTVLADLFELIHGSKPADQRKWLCSMALGPLKYWKFLREKAAAPAPPTAEKL